MTRLRRVGNGIAPLMADFLLTWKPDRWPYEKLRSLVDAFESGKKVIEPWRFAAHKRVAAGDRVYILKQGRGSKGIFAIGTVSGVPRRNPRARRGEQPWQVPITFQALVDPTQRFLVEERDLPPLRRARHRWSPQSSGVSLEPEAARAIDSLVPSDATVRGDEADDDPFDPKDIGDGRERIRRAIMVRRGQAAFRAKLIDAYGRRCAISDCEIIDLLEAAHIVPYKGSDTNDVRNGLLLRSDLHTLFDCGFFAIDSRTMTVVLAPKLRGSSYAWLEGKALKMPSDARKRPSPLALDEHRKSFKIRRSGAISTR